MVFSLLVLRALAPQGTTLTALRLLFRCHIVQLRKHCISNQPANHYCHGHVFTMNCSREKTTSFAKLELLSHPKFSHSSYEKQCEMVLAEMSEMCEDMK